MHGMSKSRSETGVAPLETGLASLSWHHGGRVDTDAIDAQSGHECESTLGGCRSGPCFWEGGDQGISVS